MFQALAGKSIIESCGMITTLQSRLEVCTSLSLVPAMQRLKDCPFLNMHSLLPKFEFCREFMFLKFPGCSECNVLPFLARAESKILQKHPKAPNVIASLPVFV